MALASASRSTVTAASLFIPKRPTSTGATREEVAETVASRHLHGRWSRAVDGGDALRAYDQFSSTKT